MSFRRLGPILLLLAVAPMPAHATRVMHGPSYGRIFNVFWTKTPAFADGTKIGMVLTAFIHVTNYSNTVQTGSIEAVPGFRVTATEFGRSPWTRRIFLCADTATSTEGSTDAITLPGAVTFSIPANTMRTYRTGVFYKSTYCAVGTTCHTGLATEFIPAIRITVNEDRGAVGATLAHVFSQPLTGVPLCDGSSMDDHEMETTMSAAGELSGVPLTFNGGRPF